MNRIVYTLIILIGLVVTAGAQTDYIVPHKNLLYPNQVTGYSKVAKAFGVKQPKKTVTEAVNTDLTYLISGSPADLLKNSFTVSLAQPAASAGFVIKLSRKSILRQYSELINQSNNPYAGGLNGAPTNIGLGNISRHKAWLNSGILALQIKFTGGLNNNITSIFTNTKVNPKTSLQLGLVWILPGAYQYKPDQFESLATKLSAAQTDLHKSYKQLVDSRDNWKNLREELRKEPSTAQQSVDIMAATEVIDSLDKRTKKMAETFGSSVRTERDKIFDGFKAERKIYQWLVFSATGTYNENVRFTPVSDFNIATLDTARYATWNGAVSYNMFFIKEKAGQSFYLGGKANFAYSDNVQSTNAIKIKSSDGPATTVNGYSVYKPGFTADGYMADNIKRSFAFTLNTNLILFLDKARIVGLNPALDIIAATGKPVALNLTLGLAFAVPKTAGEITVNTSAKSVLNITPFVMLRDLSQGQIDVLSTFKFRNHVTFGLNFDVPFSIFGK